MPKRHPQPSARLRQPALLSWLRLARVFQKISATSARELAAYDLTEAQFDVLAQLYATDGMSQGELARALLVTKGNISQLIDRMEAKGLLRRSQEGRTNCIYLSEAGHTLAVKILPAHEALMVAQFQSLAPDEQHTLLRLLRRLDQGLR